MAQAGTIDAPRDGRLYGNDDAASEFGRLERLAMVVEAARRCGALDAVAVGGEEPN